MLYFCTFLLVVAVSFQISQGHIIYVTPGPESECPRDGSDCRTLDWYNQNSNGFFMKNNTEVRFLEGVHKLTTSIAKVKNLYNVTITGFRSSSSLHKNISEGIQQPISIIDCKSSIPSGFVFINSSKLHLKNIGLESCGANISVHYGKYSAVAALSFQTGSNIQLHRVVVNNTRGFGLHSSDVFDSFSITESAFLRSKGQKSGPKSGGNARFWFGHQCGEQCSNPETHLKVTSSQFLDGQIGLEVIIDCPNIYVVIENTTIRNNIGEQGGNLALTVTNSGKPLNEPIINISNSYIENGIATNGGGLRFWSRPEDKNTSIICTETNIHKVLYVYNTTFRSNFASSTGGAVHMVHYQSGGFDCIVKSLYFILCKFEHNFGNGAVMEITKHLILANHASPQLEVRLENCTFLNNSIPSDTSSPVLSFIMTYIVMTNCIIADSNGTAVSLYNSNLNLYEYVHFENNHAKYGGALKVCERSFIFLHNNSHIHFINNTALMGGAIFIQQSCLETALPCTFQPAMKEDIPIEEFNTFLKYDFRDNSASIAGDVIYGGTLATCYTIGTYSYYRHGNKSVFNFLNIFKEIFNLTAQTGPSNISSYPQGVCFCGTTRSELTPECQKDLQLLDVYPGEEFTVSAITVGQLNGSTIGTIQSTLEEEGSFHQLVVSNGGKYSNQCVPLSFSVLSNESIATIILKPLVERYNKYFTVNISVHLLPCPLGFELINTGGQYKCDCSSLFQHHLGSFSQTIECDITTQTIHRSAPIWFGCYEGENHSLINNDTFCESPVKSHRCNYYCSSDSLNISISDLDKQCIRGRTGVLCGACKPGLSHILGLSHECRKCSNKKLYLYIPSRLISGVFILFILTVLNVTVTEGTINGLIFYSTFLYTCRNYFFYNYHIQDSYRLSKTFWVFVAWLNLNSGFDACAYDGMTGYQYIWLTFGFVFSLLFLQVVIIILSRKFIFFTRLFGRNVLKVLATLLFLTHSQLMYACFHSLQYAPLYVKTLNGTQTVTVYVWSFDGNIPYFGLKHIILFSLAAVCLFLILFFTACLLFIQCLQKHNNRWYLCWVEKLRPFFEAYTGPCHDDYRFWPGLLHLLRTLVYILSIYFSNNETYYRQWKMFMIAAFCIFVMALACIFPRGVYKKWPLNVLEFFYFMNVCILCIFLGYYKHPHLPVFVSVSLVMVTCVGLLFYHTYQRIKTTKAWSKILKWMPVHLQRFHKRKSDCKLSEECDLLLPQQLPAVARFQAFREPLLDDD